MTPDQEIRLRVVEALTRSDGSMARNQPDTFIASVAKIETYVINGNPAEKPKPEPQPEAPPEPKASKGRGSKADKAAEESTDFLK